MWLTYSLSLYNLHTIKSNIKCMFQVYRCSNVSCRILNCVQRLLSVTLALYKLHWNVLYVSYCDNVTPLIIKVKLFLPWRVRGMRLRSHTHTHDWMTTQFDLTWHSLRLLHKINWLAITDQTHVSTHINKAEATFKSRMNVEDWMFQVNLNNNERNSNRNGNHKRQTYLSCSLRKLVQIRTKFEFYIGCHCVFQM